ncbi:MULTISPECIES: hypothetical protein [unclassified Sphingopyxis]|uniref:hypothetical protein n=1 Tax=unclassified Sphingopyxis TaxID=2614943 RepID=UPI000A6C470C|nr:MULTISPECIES: hypothetical protein [unclassified Sphingopyxis]
MAEIMAQLGRVCDDAVHGEDQGEGREPVVRGRLRRPEGQVLLYGGSPIGFLRR